MISTAPKSSQLESLAHETLAAMPPQFAAHLGDIVLVVEEWPSDELLDHFGMESPYELTGLYEGTPIGEKSVSDSGAMPDRIVLFRRPLLEEWVETGVALDALIAHVVVHEVGHHFGLSDADMHALEDMVAGVEE